MSVPAVNINTLDGTLGTVQGGLRPTAHVGPADSGALNTPTTLSRTTALSTLLGGGPTLESAAYNVAAWGRPAMVVRAAESTPGSYPAGATVVFTGTGTSVITVDDAGTEPNDDYEVEFRVVTGGTIGTAGITFTYSLDGGRTRSGVIALGTATTYVIPGSGGIELEFAVGTLVAGDTATFETRAPACTAADLNSALDALIATQAEFEGIHICTPIDATLFDAIEVKMASLIAAGKARYWVGNFRLPNTSETEAAYLTAFSTALGGKATTKGCVCAGSGLITSGISGRKYTRPVSHYVAAHHSAVEEHIDIADVNLGGARGVAIRDANGNPLKHDEYSSPGLDDARATVLRTWPSIQGVYCNRPRIFSANGSDFFLVPHTRVLNLAHETLIPYFVRRLNRPVRVNATTGFILEADAAEIEQGATRLLRAVLLAAPKASAVEVTIARDDNLLSTRTMTGQARVTPLAYPEFANLDLGFYNPALAVVTV